ncbi:hypothetical protein D3C78_1170680 [compost metagenome]
MENDASSIVLTPPFMVRCGKYITKESFMLYIRKLLIVSTVIILLAACSNSKEKEFAGLVAQAEAHYHDAEYSSAITVYEKALELREDKDARSALASLKKEAQRIGEARALWVELSNVSRSHTNVFDKESLFDFVEDIRNAIIKIDNFEVSSDDFPSSFIDKFRSSNEYGMLSRQLELVEGTHTIGLPSANVTEDVDTIRDLLSRLIEEYPLPHGFGE